MRKFITEFIIGFFLIFVFSYASAENISNCQNIYYPGEYTLTQDIINFDGTCFNIYSNNVIFDCQNHIIDGTSNPYGPVAINIVDVSNVTIKNCYFSDWSYDTIYIIRQWSISPPVENISIENSTFNHDSNGIEINSAVNVTMRNIKFISEKKDFITAPYDNYYCVRIFGGGKHSIVNSKFDSCSGYAVWITDGSTDNSIINSSFIGGYVGVDAIRSSGTKVNNCSFYGFSIGIELGSNGIISNSIFINNNLGMTIWGSNNSIYNNKILQGSLSDAWGGIRIGGGNFIFNNLINYTTPVVLMPIGYKYVDTLPVPIWGVNYWNTTRQYGLKIYPYGTEIGGNYWTNPYGTGYSDTCIDANQDGFCDEPYDLFGDGINVDYLPYSNYTPPTLPSYPSVNITAPIDLITFFFTPFFFLIVLSLAVAVKVESMVKSNGYAFLLTFFGLILLFTIFSGYIPVWFFILILIITIGGFILLGRR